MWKLIRTGLDGASILGGFLTTPEAVNPCKLDPRDLPNISTGFNPFDGLQTVIQNKMRTWREKDQKETEEYLEKQIQLLPTVYPVFPGCFESEGMWLRNMKDMSKIAKMVAHLAKQLITPYDAGVASWVSPQTFLLKCVDFMVNKVNVDKALLELKIDRKIAKSAASFIKAEIEAVERQVTFLSESTGIERLNHLIIADDSCYKLLRKFMDDTLYLKKYPFASAAVFANFVTIYVPIAAANYQITSSVIKKVEIKRNMEQLRSTLEEYKNGTISARKKFIKERHSVGGIVTLQDEFLHPMDRDLLECYNTDPDNFYIPFIIPELKKAYCEKVSRAYTKYFTPAENCIEQFYLIDW